MLPDTVELRPEEIEGAIYIGWRRAFDAYTRGRTPNDAHSDDIEGTYFLGAVGEKAFAKLTGLYWPGTWTPDKDRGDVGGYDVKARGNPDGGLIVRPKMADTLRLALMVPLARGDLRRWRCPGTFIAGDGKRDEFRATLDPKKPPAWEVPQECLVRLAFAGPLAWRIVA
jgi:hypothetical protein